MVCEPYRTENHLQQANSVRDLAALAWYGDDRMMEWLGQWDVIIKAVNVRYINKHLAKSKHGKLSVEVLLLGSIKLLRNKFDKFKAVTCKYFFDLSFRSFSAGCPILRQMVDYH